MPENNHPEISLIHVRPDTHSAERRVIDLNGDIQYVLDDIPFYIIIVDAHHRILHANKMVRDIYGVGKDSLYGAFCPKVMHGSDEPVDYCPLEQAVRENRPVSTEFFEESTGRWYTSSVYPSSCTTVDGRAMYYHSTHDITDKKLADEALKLSYDRLLRANEAAIRTISRIVETRDPYTAGHQLRVSKLAYQISLELGFTQMEAEGVKLAGLLHDVGKIAIPIEILSRPGKLSEQEFNIIKLHPRAGYDILKDIEFSGQVLQAVLQHHERIDGSGYPDGLKNDEIVISAKIIAVADVMEAIRSHRPYRAALPKSKALEEIISKQGILYDTEVVNACLKLFKEKGFLID